MLNIDSLSKEFIMHIRGDAQIDGFQDISFSVEPGTLVAITGPSGSGKSSLLKCVYRTYTPTGGHAWYTREDGSTVDLATAEPGKKKLAMSPSFSESSPVSPPWISSPTRKPPGG